MEKFFEKIWYKKYSYYLIILLPISFLFLLIIKIRIFLYKNNILKKYESKVPVLIVGNISVGGSGKTPFVIWLANYLTQKNLNVGIVSSGYKSSSCKAMFVDRHSDPRMVGDEAVIFAHKTSCNIVSGGNRVEANKLLISKNVYDLIIHDDGLQHYKLKRDYEIILVNSHILFGNQLMLPAGPLREPISRLSQADITAYSNSIDKDIYAIASINNSIKNLDSGNIKKIKDFSYKKIHLVTGIASTDEIISTLNNNKIQYIMHKYDDHHTYNGDEIIFDDDLPVFITYKDYVKLSKIKNKKVWIIEHTIEPNKLFMDKITTDLSALLHYEK